MSKKAGTVETKKTMANKPLKKKSNKFKRMIEGSENSKNLNVLSSMTAEQLEAEIKRITERNERIPDEFIKNKVEVIDMFLKKLQPSQSTKKTEKKGKTTSPEVSEEITV